MHEKYTPPVIHFPDALFINERNDTCWLSVLRGVRKGISGGWEISVKVHRSSGYSTACGRTLSFPITKSNGLRVYVRFYWPELAVSCPAAGGAVRRWPTGLWLCSPWAPGFLLTVCGSSSRWLSVCCPKVSGQFTSFGFSSTRRFCIIHKLIRSIWIMLTSFPETQTSNLLACVI